MAKNGPRRLTPLNIVGVIVCLALFFLGLGLLGSAFDDPNRSGRLVFALGLVSITLAFLIPQQILNKIDGKRGVHQDIRKADGSVARYNSLGIDIYEKQL